MSPHPVMVADVLADEHLVHGHPGCGSVPPAPPALPQTEPGARTCPGRDFEVSPYLS